jgi:5-methylcytosine-specific restriction protein B
MSATEKTYNYYPRLEQFLGQARTDSQARKDYSEEVYGLSVKASFGFGQSAHIPWVSFTAEGQVTSEGIYPVYLYYKEQNLLVLAYGVSETDAAIIEWPDNGASLINDYFQRQYQASPRRYGNSFVFKAYDLNQDLSQDEVNQDLFELVQEYKAVLVPAEPTVSETPPAWLLTWNPKKFNANISGNDQSYSAGISVGDVTRWSCNSQQPKKGDAVYLIRVGLHPKGVFAKGHVEKEYYIDESWEGSDSKPRGYIDVRFTDVRENCNEGLLPQRLLKLADVDQQWSPIGSGIEIKSTSIIDKLWSNGEGKSSLRQFVDWSSADRTSSNQTWLKHYAETVRRVSDLREHPENLNDELLSDIWRHHSNGISRVSPQQLSNDDYDRNLDLFRGLTLKIVEEASLDQLLKAYKLWKDLKVQGGISQVYWSVLHRVFSAASPTMYTTILNKKKCIALLKILDQEFELSNKRIAGWYELNTEIKRCMHEADLDPEMLLENNIAMWQLFESDDGSSSINEDSNEYRVKIKSNSKESLMQPLNQIFYGPPGTGKTYKTINEALRILEPDLDIDKTERKDLKSKFDKYKKDGRVQFVTFHQSFSYEDFVEGLRADSEDGSITYKVESGVFKQICNSAQSLPGTSLNDFDVAIDRLIEHCDKLDGRLEIETVRGNKFAVEYSGGDTFKVYPHATENENPNYVASIENVRKLYISGSKKGLYNTSYVEGVLNFLKSSMGLVDYNSNRGIDRHDQPVVLIIDEINRGNISSIFGELITLIEPGKREGADEALSVTLPYSKEPFSVPKNLHIIGTMNTADRSLALMDTALRRRFDFVEMMPNLDLLQDLEVEGISIAKMLQKMNQRIEVLYDREHMLGHAFFMPLLQASEGQHFSMLQGIFKNKILPLLEEYFFEDWEKIRLVLGDNQKDNQDLAFIVEQADYSAEALFGNTDGLNDMGIDEIQTYKCNYYALGEAAAYRGIYDA